MRRIVLLASIRAEEGLMQFSRLTAGDPTAASGLGLDAIAAVVIGGATLSGGAGLVGSKLPVSMQ